MTDHALRDLLSAGEVDAPGFGYRVRLVTGHLIEAIDSLTAYSQGAMPTLACRPELILGPIAPTRRPTMYPLGVAWVKTRRYRSHTRPRSTDGPGRR